ncbi:MAG: class I SAM-dependent methyltransferase [Elusimicrobiota bacterium]
MTQNTKFPGPRRGRSWWERHFDEDSLRGYGLEKDAESQVRGIPRLIRLSPPAAILDLCCGAGRHAVRLAERGFRVTGLDQSAPLLGQAAEAARAAGVSLDLRRGDMRRLRFRARFDAVLNLFTSFGYFPTEAEDLAVLRGIWRSLKPGGTLLVDVLNKEWLMRHFTPVFWQRKPEGRVLRAHNRLSFDLKTGRLSNRRTLYIRGGGLKRTFLRFRVYTLHELLRLLAAAGFSSPRTYGGFDGRPYGMDTKRMVVRARRPR